jgi:hypothetical protein
MTEICINSIRMFALILSKNFFLHRWMTGIGPYKSITINTSRLKRVRLFLLFQAYVIEKILSEQDCH